MQLRRILLMSAFTATGLPLLGQTTNLAHPTPVAATAHTAVPALVPYNAIAAGSDGKALVLGSAGDEVSMTFLLFKDETGGEPLWTESQRVTVDSLGHYNVQLGSSSPSGMPLTVFASGEARWLEVQIAGQKQQARVLLSSVPYAAKAADSATLGGLPASAFMLAGTPAAIAASTTGSIMSDTTSNVTTTGGTSKYLPKFTGATSIGNSQIYDNGTNVGIGVVPSPSVKLDVGGAMIMRGPMIVTRTDNATPSQAFPSFGFAFYSNVYDSSSHATDNPHYILQSEPHGNNTSNTSATFNLLYSNHGSTPTETGFYVNTNGTLHFASGQTFPGTGNGDITGVTAGTDLTGGGTSGNVTLNLNTSLTDARYAQLNANNTFSGYLFAHNQVIAEADGVTAGVEGLVDDSSFAGVLGEGNVGVYGYSDQSGVGTTESTGVYGQSGGQSATGSDFNTQAAGVYADGGAANGDGYSGLGILAATDNRNAGILLNSSQDYYTLVLINYASGGYMLNAVNQSSGANCEINGSADLSCTGTISGSNVAAVSGRIVKTYGVQSAENWYEDAGSGKLESGVAHVKLDPMFGETVNTDVEYHVFITPNGESNGLYVSNKTASGFEVHETGSGRSSIGFDYRIMAKRKGYEKVRLEDITEKQKKMMQQLKQPVSKPAHAPVLAARRSPVPVKLPTVRVP